MVIKKIIAFSCALIVLTATCGTALAESAPYSLPTNQTDESTNEVITLTVEKSVDFGLKNNTSIKMLDNKIDVASITNRNAIKNKEDLEEAQEALDDAQDELRDKKALLKDSQSDLDSAQTALDNGIAPQAIPLTDNAGHPVTDGSGNPIIIPLGANILNFLLGIGMPADQAAATQAQIVQYIQSQIDNNQATIDEGEIAISEAEDLLASNEEQFRNILKDTSESIGTKLNYNSIVELSAEDAGELMITMAGVNLNITKYAKAIYRNQIAMLIQKNYYDALYARKVMELKKISTDRGKKQYDMVKLSYDNGMKAKDDYFLAKMYWDSTAIAYRLAQANYKNAIFELKKNMNMNMNQEILLEDSMIKTVTTENLEDGLKSGLTNRIEVQQALGQLMIYELNEDLIVGHYGAEPYPSKEAKLLKENAQLQLEKTKTTVNTEIHQSYETMVATGEMLQASGELTQNAQEVVAIAKLKYEQGFGAENALLKQLNLQESSGTIVELIAAQEKLSEVEAQVAQITYSYTLSKIKYFNDSGILTY